VIAGHGDIYVNPALFEILTWELVDKYSGRPRAAVTTDRVAVNFVPDRDLYAPGDQIGLRASVNLTAGGSPVSGATVDVQMTWRGALPGSEPPARPGDLPHSTLAESGQLAGRYDGALAAPAAEGYYQLTATVLVPFEKPVDLTELIVVDSPPT
jgi:hypothetical protein